MGKMCEILSYDKIFRLSSAQCLHPCVKPLIGGGGAASRNFLRQSSSTQNRIYFIVIDTFRLCKPLFLESSNIFDFFKMVCTLGRISFS